VAVPADATEIPVLVALVAKNLTSNEARDVMAELGAKKSGSEGALPAASTEPQSGLYVRLSFGIGYGAAAYSIRGVTNGTTATTSEVLKVGLTIADAGFHVAVGKMSASGLAIGGELSGSFAYLDQHGSLGKQALSVATPAQLGVFVDDYLDARGPLHLQGGAALAWTPFAYSVTEPAAVGPVGPVGTANAGKVSPLFGVTGYVGAGYDFGPRGMGGFGLFARTCFGYYGDSDASFVPLGFRVGVSGAWL
jgi:hypothetical protein